LNAPRQATGGSTFVDAQNAVTSAAATVLQINTRQSTQPPLDTQSFLVSNLANTGFMIIVLTNLSTAQNSVLHIRIHWTSQPPGLLDGFRMIGKRGSAIKTAIPPKVSPTLDIARQQHLIGQSAYHRIIDCTDTDALCVRRGRVCILRELQAMPFRVRLRGSRVMDDTLVVLKSIFPDDIDWWPFAAFPPEARLAVLVGHPAEAGMYVIRVKLPGGVKLMPHRHPENRIYTVMSRVT
jgi:hypothetical protein